MVKGKATVINPKGLHLKPASFLCELALQYQSKIYFEFDRTRANAKSVLSVLGAGVSQGMELEFMCEGFDEEEALTAIIEAVKSGLGEKIE